VNERQRRVLEFMRADPRKRDLYQARDYTSNCVTHSGDFPDLPILTNEEADELVALGHIEPRWANAKNLRYWCIKGYQT